MERKEESIGEKGGLVMSFVQVMSHSGALGSDRTPFYGVKVPVEVKSLVKLCKTVEHSLMKNVLKGQQVTHYS